MKIKVALLLLLINTFACFSQKKINVKGIVKDTEHNFLSGATVIVQKLDSSEILVYSITDLNGFFSLNVSSELDSLEIKVSYLGYKSQTKKILNDTIALDFALSESSEELKEIIIKNSIIEKKGDTISYSVAKFKSDKDRVIADVLNKMPGIEVQLDGKILYQGKAIEKYYIEGLDLFEGKYNLANNNLPADEVSKVQILENHQPIRVLDSLVFSENTSLNIKLKKGSVLVVPSSLGVGYKQPLYELSTTPMNFNKNNQFFGNFKLNNSGIDVAKELKVLTLDDFMNQKEENILDLLQISPIVTPSTSEKRWLDNQIFFSSFNFLNKLKNNYELKVSASYVNDLQILRGSTKTIFLIGDNQVEIIENSKNSYSINELLSKITFENNSKKKYFKNSIEVNANWNSDEGNIINQSTVFQKLTKPNSQLNNVLKWIFPVKKTLMNIDSKIFFSNRTSKLTILPGFFEDLLTNGNSFNTVIQNLFQDYLFTDNSLGFTKSYKQFTFSPKVGFAYQHQHLESKIFTDSEQNFNDSNEFQNDLTYAKTFFFASTLIQFQQNLFKFNILLPIRTVTIKSLNKVSFNKKNLTKTVFEPNFSISRELGAFWKLGVSSSYENKFGNITDLYDGFIIKDYRNIFSYDSSINEKNIQMHKASISYQDYIKGVFITTRYSNRKQVSNILFDYEFNSNGALQLKAIEESNTSKDETFMIRTSKFFNKINTTLNLDVNLMTNKRERIINNNLILFNNKQSIVKFEIDYEFAEWLNILGKKVFANSSSKSDDIRIQNLQRNTNYAEINLYPTKSQLFQITYESMFIKNAANQTNQFLDATYRYTFRNDKSEISFHWINILNKNSFVDNFISDNSQIQTNFFLKPSQIMIHYKFTF